VPGSSEESAFIRAVLFLFKLGLSRAFPEADVVTGDDSNREPLDFNLQTTGEMNKLIAKRDTAYTELV
jgi:hypothetical protein